MKGDTCVPSEAGSSATVIEKVATVATGAPQGEHGHRVADTFDSDFVDGDAAAVDQALDASGG